MSECLAVIEAISREGVELNGKTEGTEEINGEEEVVIDEKELEDQVNDLVEIRKKDVLKKNLMNIVRENLTLKRQIKILESKLASQSSADDSYNLLFRIDTEGDEVQEPSDIPHANSSLILTNSQEDVPVEETKKAGGNKCFNCLGDHLISDCPEPRNPKEINKNKKIFQNNMVNNARYHVDEQQRFGHLRPGLPSAKLREALRLRSDQLPEYVYKMRAMGYSPGWMKHAEINASGINMYHDRGEKIREAGEEDGEVRDERDGVQYDINKLIKWPGFNSSLPKEFRDETDKYRVPSLSRTERIEDLVERLKPQQQQGYVRKKMQETSSDITSDLIILDSTVELDSDQEMEDATPLSNDKNVPAEKTTEVRAELEAETGVEVGAEVEAETGVEVGAESQELHESAVSSQETSVSVAQSTPSRQSSWSSVNSVSKTEPGTPIVEIYSPFQNLPSRERFGKDMTEHIVFENPPDYTGTFEKIRSVLKSDRKRKAQSESSSQESS